MPRSYYRNAGARQVYFFSSTRPCFTGTKNELLPKEDGLTRRNGSGGKNPIQVVVDSHTYCLYVGGFGSGSGGLLQWGGIIVYQSVDLGDKERRMRGMHCMPLFALHGFSGRFFVLVAVGGATAICFPTPVRERKFPV